MEAKPNAQSDTASGLTLLSLSLGLIQVLVVCLGAPYAIWVLGSSEITWSFFPIAVGFSFCCLILLNILLKTINPGWAIRPAEMITVVVMGLVTTGIPIFMMGFVMTDIHGIRLPCSEKPAKAGTTYKICSRINYTPYMPHSGIIHCGQPPSIVFVYTNFTLQWILTFRK